MPRAVFWGLSAVFLFFPSAFIAEAEGGYAQSDYVLSKFLADGQKQLYAGEYKKAAELFDEHIKRHSDDPVGYWRRGYAEYMLVRARNKDDEPRVNDRVAYTEIIVLLDTGINMAEVKIRDGKDADFHRFVEAATFGLKAVFERTNGFPWSSRDSAERMRELTGNSRYQDASYIPGLLEYRISKLDFFTRFVAARIFGLPKDRKNGLRLIAEALHGNSGPFADDIKFVALSIFCDLGGEELKEAEKILRFERAQFLRYVEYQYPRNPLVRECNTKNY